MLDTTRVGVADATHGLFSAQGACLRDAVPRDGRGTPAGTTPIAIDWFVARVGTARRDVIRTRDTLLERGWEVYDPRFVVHDRAGDQVRRYFPGYLLVGRRAGQELAELFDPALPVVPGLYALLADGQTGRAIQVPAASMDQWRLRCGPTGIHDPTPPKQAVKPLPPGTRVVVTGPDGSPFVGLHAIVRMGEGDRVQALMDLLGGAPVELRRGQVEVA